VWKPANWLKAIARRALPNAMQDSLRTFYLTRKVLADKEYVEPEMAMLQSIVAPGQVAVDIGANVGSYTILLSRLVGPSGRVYSFEPIPENFRILEGVVRGGRLANVKAFPLAMDRLPGDRDMAIPDRSDFTGFYQARLADKGDSGQRRHVKVVSLDQLCRDGILSYVHFIKCDAEGSELGILQGGIELLKKNHPSLLVEVLRKTGVELFRLVYGLGYRSFILDGGLVETDHFDPKFWNYFFLDREKAPEAPGRLIGGASKES
jgi:FkbM family methyltransferase